MRQPGRAVSGAAVGGRVRMLRLAEITGAPGLAHVAATRVPAGARTFRHGHDFEELFLVTGGRGVHCWNDRDVLLERGWLVIVGRGDEHHYRAAAAESLQFTNLAVPGAWWDAFAGLVPAAREVPARADAPAGHRRLPPGDVAAVEEELHRLMERVEPEVLVAVVAGLVARLTGRGGRGGAVEQAGRSAPEWLARLLRDLEDPGLVAQPIGAWQRRSGRSAAHLARECRRHCGSTLTGLLQRARVDLVKRGLRRGEDKVAYLALAAGFGNLGHFHRTFRRLEGCTPGEWAARHGGEAAVPR